MHASGQAEFEFMSQLQFGVEIRDFDASYLNQPGRVIVAIVRPQPKALARWMKRTTFLSLRRTRVFHRQVCYSASALTYTNMARVKCSTA